MLSESMDDDPIIEEIWSWEAVSHGDPAVINKQNLSAFCKHPPPPRAGRFWLTLVTLDVVEWSDNSRDIINFLTYYLPDTVGYSRDQLPTHLPLVPREVSEARAKGGFTNRTLVAAGHSFGGCTM